jgi:hypothetical protein
MVIGLELCPCHSVRLCSFIDHRSINFPELLRILGLVEVLGLLEAKVLNRYCLMVAFSVVADSHFHSFHTVPYCVHTWLLFARSCEIPWASGAFLTPTELDSSCRMKITVVVDLFIETFGIS